MLVQQGVRSLPPGLDPDGLEPLRYILYNGLLAVSATQRSARARRRAGVPVRVQVQGTGSESGSEPESESGSESEFSGSGKAVIKGLVGWSPVG